LREAQPAQLQKFEGQVRFNFEKSQQHLGGADYTRTAAIAKVGFGRKPALYPGRAESRLFDMALKLSKMV
jgi:hypothetical protein